jgi:ankyrin repeat protein
MPSSKRKYQRKSRSKRAKKKSRRNDGTLDEYNKLIEKFKIKDKDNRTLLMKLVHHDNIDYVRKYMKDEIESKLSPSEQIEYVNRKDEFGYTALSLASINGNLKLIRYLLLEKKAFKDPKYLIYVINANKLETTKKIINDETTTNQHSLTMALFYCVQNDFDNEIIECLLDNIEFKSELIVYLEEALSDIEKKKSKENEKEVKLITGVILEIRKYLEKYS